jgi:hypothetical protein
MANPSQHNVVVTLPYGAAAPVEGKFVQLRLRGKEYLLFAAPELHRFHNQILADFLEHQHIAYHWTDNQTLAIDLPELTVVGGGRFRADGDTRTLTLWDNSQAYGRFDERGLKEKIGSAESPWKDFSITIAA